MYEPNARRSVDWKLKVPPNFADAAPVARPRTMTAAAATTTSRRPVRAPWLSARRAAIAITKATAGSNASELAFVRMAAVVAASMASTTARVARPRNTFTPSQNVNAHNGIRPASGLIEAEMKEAMG
jgi:hypothetical protein